jgi:hypothetical protein
MCGALTSLCFTTSANPSHLAIGYAQQLACFAAADSFVRLSGSLSRPTSLFLTQRACPHAFSIRTFSLSSNNGPKTVQKTVSKKQCPKTVSKKLLTRLRLCISVRPPRGHKADVLLFQVAEFSRAHTRLIQYRNNFTPS